MTARADPTDTHRWPADFRSEIACDLQVVYDVIGSAKRFLVSRGLTEGDAAQWELVMAEAVNNGIQYCRPEARNQPLLLEVTLTGGKVVARLTDHTSGLTLPENPKLPPPASEHGRGLFLIHHFTDAVTYHRHGDHNILEMHRSHAASR